MLLVFASSIFVLVKDVEAVNHFMKNSSDEDLLNCDYIEFVMHVSFTFISSDIYLLSETVPFPISLQVSSGQS